MSFLMPLRSRQKCTIPWHDYAFICSISLIEYLPLHSASNTCPAGKRRTDSSRVPVGVSRLGAAVNYLFAACARCLQRRVCVHSPPNRLHQRRTNDIRVVFCARSEHLNPLQARLSGNGLDPVGCSVIQPTSFRWRKALIVAKLR